MQNKWKISFIGGGNMAGALIGGLMQGISIPIKIHVVDRNEFQCNFLKQTFKVSVSTSCDAQLENSDVIVLAVKPQHIQQATTELEPYLQHAMILSVVAGVRTHQLSRWLTPHRPASTRAPLAIVRTMPNMPALIGKGVTGMFATKTVSATQKNIANAMMRAVGSTLWVPKESLLDSVTAVSGSGPAYIFYFIEAMIEAAQQLGLKTEHAKNLVLATFAGAIELALQSDDSVAILRSRVTSKGGTTAAALEVLEQHDVAATFIAAIHHAAARSKELGDLLDENDPSLSNQ